MQNLDAIVNEACGAFAATSDPDALEQVKARYLGKTGQITELKKGLGKLPPEEKKTAGADINRAKREIERAEKRRVAAEADALRKEIEAFNAETAELELRAAQKAARDARYAARKQRRK